MSALSESYVIKLDSVVSVCQDRDLASQVGHWHSCGSGIIDSAVRHSRI